MSVCTTQRLIIFLTFLWTKPDISLFGIGKISAAQCCVNSICHPGNGSHIVDGQKCFVLFSTARPVFPLWSDIMPPWCDSMFDQIIAARFASDFGLLACAT